jgi:hypothetical protein
MQSRRLDPLDLAWAAGFFDGEGSTIARRDRARPGYRQLQLAVPQSGSDRQPEVLVRFQRALFGMGMISARGKDGVYQWRSNGYLEGHTTLRLLWRHLGPVKRRQAAESLLAVRAQYRAGGVRRLPPRARTSVPSARDRRDLQGARDALAEERAWAAGFIDAEGCFGLVRARVRRDGVTWYRIRASASQHGSIGAPPVVLTKLRRILGAGRIERHGEIDDFKWLIEGVPGIRTMLEVVGAHLGSVKLAQARDAIGAYLAQPRIRGDRTRCKRGHPYDRRMTLNGRTRAVCNTCTRLMERRRRSALGIPPRQFTNVNRRYTE